VHIPDGFLTPPVWGAFDVLAIPSFAILARRAQRDTDDRRIPLMGVMGAFIFAAQMINFPVGPGTSGHLVGGTLLAITLGPAPAAVVMTAILAIQALVFQDGGILALGANVFNMAIAGVLAGYAPYRLFKSSTGIAIGGAASVMVSGCFALGELSVSRVPLPGKVLWVTLTFFLVNAVLEGAITLAAVRAIGRLNPAILNQARARNEAGPGGRVLALVAVAATVLAVAGFLVASTHPDGIEMLSRAQAPAWLHAPLADYQAHGIESPWLRKSVAGLAGLILIYLVCMAAGRWIRQRNA
jgi:cobalt/nickel transport system permease protein